MSLDADEYVEIARKGFAAVPDFASTIHVATGRSLNSVIPDLGGVAEPASFNAMMRGYIALSRATDGEGVLIARPFSPNLFKLGKQPFATLLLETLQGKKAEKKLPELWATAAAEVRDAPKSKLILDTKWTCGVCGKEKEGREFLEKQDRPNWSNAILLRVLAPGPFRRCVDCDPTCKSSIICYVCRKGPDRAQFSNSAWHHKADKDQNVRCYDCNHPVCSVPGCVTCKSCRDVNCTEKDCNKLPVALNSMLLPQEYKDVEKFRCQRCVFTCSICEETKDATLFSKSAYHHKGDYSRTLRCNECSHPACTNPGCRTCRSCRKVTCARFYCSESPKPLNSKQLPKTREELQNFRCANCKDDPLYTCVGCKKAKSEEAFKGEDMKAYAKKPHSKKLLCLECVAQGRTTRDTELYTCRQCVRELGRLKFDKEAIKKHFQRGSLKSMRCTECKL